ncbi:uncharacterized protein LOC127276774 [Leptopilina boulardi]|uniref:uncharacterized protein LOC127276774 n=1 Tax=Leptopilina boulardi TaxID=63433 RepID=UPI0021F575F5|nr:uncharacterized protein LOC127276774 [Leptopilina boulardi]
MSSRYLKLLQICDFVKGNLNRRNMTEGEAVLKAGQVVLVGCLLKTENKIDIIGLVLQTSALTSFPHKLEGILKFASNSNIEIEQMDCSCKGGQSGACKHVVAILLFLERNNMDLENLSCTDLQCT